MDGITRYVTKGRRRREVRGASAMRRRDFWVGRQESERAERTARVVSASVGELNALPPVVQGRIGPSFLRSSLVPASSLPLVLGRT